MRYEMPDELISTAAKLAVEGDNDVPTFIKKVRDHFSDFANGSIGHKAELMRLVDVANGNFNNADSDYNHVINPYNEPDTKKRKKFPAKLRNYDIISPIIDRFMGERRDRPNDSIVYNRAPNGTNAFKEQLQAEYKRRLAAHLLLEMQKMGFDVDAGIDQVPNYTTLKEDVETNWGDTRAAMGQEALDYITASQDLPNAFQRAYYNFLVTGFTFGFKEICYNDIKYHPVDPLEVDVYGWDTTSRYAEDAKAVIRRMKWSANSVIDHFRNNLSEEQVQTLLKWEKDRTPMNGIPSTRGAIVTRDGTYFEYDDGQLVVEHIVWKTLTKRGILKYVSITGNEDEIPVDETYVLSPENGDLGVDWVWENEWWEIWTVSRNYGPDHNNEVIFLDYGPGEVQRTMINNTSSCKLPYNGTYLAATPYVIRSVVKSGLPYQQLYNIFHFYFERSMAKNKDKLMLFPLGLIPRHKDWNEQKWLYTIEAFSIAFFDESADKALASLQAIKEIDMSLYQYMGKMWEFMQAIKNEWWESVGFNPQRYGDIATSAGKGTTNQAIIRSAISALEMNMMFERFREKEEEALLDYSKFAWIDGKKGTFVRPDKTVVYFDINGIEHAENEYGVFVNNSTQDQAAVDFIKSQILQPLAQNGLGGDIIAEVVDAKGMPKIKELLARGMRIQQEYQQQLEESRNQAQTQVAQTQERIEAMKDQRERDLAQLKADTEIEKALIMSDSFNAAAGDADANGITESDEIVQRHYDRMNKQQEFGEKRRANMAKEQIAREGIAVKREDIEAKKQIASMNKNKYDK